MNKSITITNGVGTADIINGTYNISAQVDGYNNSTINPSSVTIDSTTNTYSFTIAANGTLTLHVTEDGTASGTPVVGATFVRTDSTGTEYGTVITSDSNGDAVFNNVPYNTTLAPTIYYKQTASDGEHEFDDEIQSTTMTTQTQTIQIENEKGATRTLTLTDANYENLPIENGTITFSN